MPAGTVSNGLPIELPDARPSGFLGRHFILVAMSRRGEDVPGNLIVGDESFARWQALQIVVKARHDYPELAEATIAGHPPGSSAGGERPKFGILVDGRHMLVKFAARGGGGDVVARRWCDLLVLEALALTVVSSHGISAAHTNIVETPSHCFLESERFDRVGVRGRVAVLSLAAVHDDPADSWARAAVLLRDAGRLAHEDARRLPSIRCRCYTRRRRMAKYHLESLRCRTQLPTRWTCGMTRAWRRVSSGSGQAMTVAYQMTFGVLVPPTPRRS